MSASEFEPILEADYDRPEWLSLDDDEEIVWAGSPELASRISTFATGVVMTPAFGIGLLMIASTYLGVKNTEYVITNKALYAKSGVLSTNIENVGLDRVQNSQFSQGFIDGKLGFGSVEISTAGSSGAEVTFVSIENAREIQELLSTLGREFQSEDRGSRGERPEEGETAAGDAALDELVTEMRETREALDRIANVFEQLQSDTGASGQPRSDGGPSKEPQRGEATSEQSGKATSGESGQRGETAPEGSSDDVSGREFDDGSKWEFDDG